jgi:hypothetical protein
MDWESQASDDVMCRLLVMNVQTRIDQNAKVQAMRFQPDDAITGIEDGQEFGSADLADVARGVFRIVEVPGVKLDEMEHVVSPMLPEDEKATAKLKNPLVPKQGKGYLRLIRPYKLKDATGRIAKSKDAFLADHVERKPDLQDRRRLIG